MWFMLIENFTCTSCGEVAFMEFEAFFLKKKFLFKWKPTWKMGN